MFLWCNFRNFAPHPEVMATITAFIRTTKDKYEDVSIRFRLRDGRGIQLYHKSEIKVAPYAWDSKLQGIKPRVLCPETMRELVTREVPLRKQLILDLYKARPSITSEELDEAIKLHHNPRKQPVTGDIHDLFNQFIEAHKVSARRKDGYRAVARTLRRFEAYSRLIGGKRLAVDEFTNHDLTAFESYMADEHEIIMRHPELAGIAPSRKHKAPRCKGRNTIGENLSRLRTFFAWCNKSGITGNNPFKGYSLPESHYGTPYYITIEERNRIHDMRLHNHPALSVQRDIFVFQCLVGCRVGDLYSLKKENVINGAIEYIPRKTKEGRPVTVRVPLNKQAKEILAKYKDTKGGRLFPFIAQQNYNYAIKDTFRAARLNRLVSVINPTTGEPELRKLSEIASSHLARRTFIGNLYKQVKDPSLIGALSGHKEGSKAFARYREIDEEMKVELVKLLE